MNKDNLWLAIRDCLSNSLGEINCLTKARSYNDELIYLDSLSHKLLSKIYSELYKEILHHNAPTNRKCADCTIDGEPCPFCYASWWRDKHPNVNILTP